MYASENIKSIHKTYCKAPFLFGPRKNTAHDHPPHTHLGPRPSSQRAGRQNGPRSVLAWAETGPSALGCSQPSIAWIVNLTVACAFRRNKTAGDCPLWTLAPFFFLLPRASRLLLWAAAASSFLAATGDGRRRWRAVSPGTRPRPAPPFVLPSFLASPLLP
jgi:hypothetical protein